MTAAQVVSIEAHRLRAIESAIRQRGDEDVANRIGELAERFEAQKSEVLVAFCGMFSAGKSSLINAITQRDSMAVGAVPTTATIAQAVLSEGETTVALLDTPGIDSTDEAHRQETEGGLHRADVVVLVMDYQQVESDGNLELARALTDQQKRLYLVIHQIDKHVEWEISFADYQARVEQTFADWGIVAEGVFYTAVVDCPHNQLDELRRALFSLADRTDAYDMNAVEPRVKSLVTEHVQGRYMDEIGKCTDEVISHFGYTPFDLREAQTWLTEKQSELNRLNQAEAEAEHDLITRQQAQRENLVRSIELSQISPYDTTEKGRMYVESLRPEFRVGWLGWKAKTEQARRERLDAFVADLSEHVQKYLIWPLASALRELIQTESWAIASWMVDVDTICAQVTPQLCRSLVKEGALVSNQYPYQYVKDVVQAVKRQVFVQLDNRLDNWFSQSLNRLRETSSTSETSRLLSEDIRVLEAWCRVQSAVARDIDDFMSAGDEN